MYKVPTDLEQQLQNKYPSINVKQFIHDLIDGVLKKCFEGGSATIREFGKFAAYKTFSNRVGREQVRFKFKTAPSLISKIKNDSYIIEHLPVQEPTPFTKKHEEVCKEKQDQRLTNRKARQDAEKMGFQHTQEELAKKEIIGMLDED